MGKFQIIFKKHAERHHTVHHHIVSSGILIIMALTAFVVGALYGQNENGAALAKDSSAVNIKISGLNDAKTEKTVNFSLYWDVWNRLQEKYIGQPVKDSNLFYGSLEGMAAATGDPYTIFLRPQKAERFNQDLSGTFSGIGAELGMKKDLITIIAPLADSPAEKAGIKAGDKILAVDGKETYGWTLDEAVSKIRGLKGTPVKLLILSNGQKAPREVTIIRDIIKVKSVVWEMKDNNIAYLKIANFSEDTAELFDEAVRKITLKNPQALVLDLRNNPGGYLDTAVRVASEWITKGAIVQEKFSDGRVETYLTNGKHRLDGLKTWILVNQGSASASEIVAGALQDYGQAMVAGEKTFGKGSVQDYEQLPDGSGLKITVAEWLTPKGRQINKNGVMPDKLLATAQATSTPAIAEEEEETAPVKDTVLEDALKMIK
ncbi:MAG: PDZ domain-containing protein [Candidatus Magasanikbacteria bacterium]|nr:PDZ domain-containing protein [Candidatus Magasanikbacteria bacterium]